MWLPAFLESVSLPFRSISCRFSIPTNFRPVFRQATPVVPDPIAKSKTVSPGLVYVRIRYSMSATGFCVGWSPSSLLLSPGICKIEHGLRPPVFTVM